jgi:hypothetical protein
VAKTCLTIEANACGDRLRAGRGEYAPRNKTSGLLHHLNNLRGYLKIGFLPPIHTNSNGYWMILDAHHSAILFDNATVQIAF